MKILFKNIKKSQPKPAQQVAGVEKKETVAATATPTVATQPSTPQPTDAPQRPSKEIASVTKSSTPRIKLKNIGTTFSSLRQGPKQPAYLAAQQAGTKTAADSNKEFTEEQLSIQWTLMCNRMPQHLVGLASRLKNIMPHIVDYPNIEVVIDNEILLSQVNDIKGNIEATMKKTLGNDQITLSLKLADIDSSRKAYTKRELFDELRRKNPAIEKLRLKLGLELA